MHIKKLTLSGFRSHVGTLTLNFEPGILYISGVNGAGKTSIVEAIYWCLYGKPIKSNTREDVVTYKHKQNSSYTGTYVSLEIIGDYDIKYVIHRTVTSIALTIEGEQVIAPAKDIQEQIDRLVGITKETYVNTVYVVQDSDSLFKQSSASLDFALSELFSDIMLYDTYIENAKAKLASINQQLATSAQLKLSANNKIISLTSICESLSQQQAKFETAKQAKLQEIDKFIELKNKEIAESEIALASFSDSVLDELHSINDNPLDNLSNELAVQKSSLDDLKASIASIKQSINKVISDIKAIQKPASKCDVCDRPFDITSYEAAMLSYNNAIEAKNEELKLLHVALDTANNKLATSNDAYSELLAKYNDLVKAEKLKKENIEKQRLEKAKCESKLQLLNAVLNEQASQKQAIINSVYDDSAKLTAENELEQAKSDLLEIANSLSVFEEQAAIGKFWATQGFSFLKAKALNSKLDKLNMYFAKAGSIVGLTPNIIKQQRGYELTVNLHGMQVPYHSLSGGEKRRADLALTYSLYMTMQSKKRINLAILDEPFDGLSAENIELAINLISDMAETIIIMSHMTINLSNATVLSL